MEAVAPLFAQVPIGVGLVNRLPGFSRSTGHMALFVATKVERP